MEDVKIGTIESMIGILFLSCILFMGVVKYVTHISNNEIKRLENSHTWTVDLYPRCASESKQLVEQCYRIVSK